MSISHPHRSVMLYGRRASRGLCCKLSRGGFCQYGKYRGPASGEITSVMQGHDGIFLPESIPATYFANFMTYGIGVAGLGESCRNIHLPAYQRILLWMRPGSQIRCVRISTFCLSY